MISQNFTFDKVENLLGEIQQHADPHVEITLVGNQSDLCPKRKVSEAEAMDFARGSSIAFLETSARHSTNVDTAFQSLEMFL